VAFCKKHFIPSKKIKDFSLVSRAFHFCVQQTVRLTAFQNVLKRVDSGENIRTPHGDPLRVWPQPGKEPQKRSRVSHSISFFRLPTELSFLASLDSWIRSLFSEERRFFQQFLFGT
jgi:hypothetical protein